MSDMKTVNQYRVEQYKICQVRGHKADNFITTNVTVGVCKYCDTHFWQQQLETNVPVGEE